MNLDRAYEYFKKAYELDPSYKDAAFTYGSQRLFLQTDTLQSGNELSKSLGMIREYVDVNPRDVYATQMYGYVATALDTVEEAIRVYENTYRLLPKETQLLQQLSDSYIRLMKTREAINALERYESIEGKSKEVTLKKITYLIAEGDTIGATTEAEELVKAHPTDPYSLLLKGNLYELIGNRDSVFNAYKAAERLAPENGAVKMSLAQYYRAEGDSVMLDNMIYEALLSEDFELEDKIGILGDYLQKLIDDEGDRKRGDHLFSVIQDQYPHEPDVLDMAARYAGAKGDYKEAAESIGYAIDMDPTNERYWMMLFSFEITDNDYEAVVRDYEKAKKYVTPTMQMKNLYSASVSMLDDSEKAKSIIGDLLIETDPRLNPATSTADDRKNVRSKLNYDNLVWVSSLYCILGDLNYKAGKAEDGFEEYEKSLYFLYDNSLTLNNFAYFLSEEGNDLDKAETMSRKAMELNPNNPTYIDTYAWILYKLGEYQKALEYMEKALELAGEEAAGNEEYQKHLEAIKKALGKE